jgi:hypothetical protein
LHAGYKKSRVGCTGVVQEIFGTQWYQILRSLSTTIDIGQWVNFNRRAQNRSLKAAATKSKASESAFRRGAAERDPGYR